MDTNTVKLFDSNNRLVSNFDDEIEKILISIHGENYYDVDEELVNTNLIPVSAVVDEDIYKDDELEKTMELVDAMVDEKAAKVKIVDNKKHKISIKDFIPVLFFILIFIVIVIAGYYFLNTIDLMSLIS